MDLWVEEVRAHPGEITGLITAPLTNFALALRREPDLPRLLKGLVIMGGSFYYQGNTTPDGGMELSVDPHAAKEVFAAYRGLPEDKLPVVCALETTELIEMRPEHLQRLAEAAGTGAGTGAAGAAGGPPQPVRQPPGGLPVRCHPLLHGVPPPLRPGLRGPHARRLRRLRGRGADGRSATELATVDVETRSPLLMGTTVADYRGLWGLPPNARIVTSNNPQQCFDELIGSVGALARRLGSG